MAQSPGDITLLIEHARTSDQVAASQLMELVYDELRWLAATYLRGAARGHTLQATALVHEAFLKLVRQADGQVAGRTHFFAVAATAMRQILTDHARAKRGGAQTRHEVERMPAADSRGGSVARARRSWRGRWRKTRPHGHTADSPEQRAGRRREKVVATGLEPVTPVV